MIGARKSAILSGVKIMIAGIMAFFIYYNVSWPYSYWIMVTIAAVAQPGFSDTFGKIIIRIVASLIGCVLAYGILFLSQNNNVVIISFFFLTVILSSYFALQETLLSYAGVVLGLTVIIILSTALRLGDLLQAVSYRMLDLLLGIACLAVVNVVLSFFFARKELTVVGFSIEFKKAYQKFIQWRKNPRFIKPSLAIAIASSLTYFPWLHWRYSGGYWATIGCFLVMEKSFVTAKQRSLSQFYSQVIAGLIAGISALLIADHTIWLLVPLSLGFFASGYLMVRSETLRISANMMGVTLAIVLFRDPGTVPTLKTIAARFVNIVGGMAIGLMVAYLVQRKKYPD